jgi:hypothetical protein
MKRILVVIMLVLIVAFQVFAASSMVVGTVLKHPTADNPSRIVIPVSLTAHTDGTFDAKTITNAEVGMSYGTQGYYLIHAWIKNAATPYAAGGAMVITDSLSQQIVSTASTDTLAFPTAGSGIVNLVSTRAYTQRPILGTLTLSPTTTTTSLSKATLYLVLDKVKGK